MLTQRFYREVAAGLRGRGAFAIAVGSGQAAWDDRPPAPARSVEALAAEVARKTVDADSITFLDDGGQAAEAPSPRLRFPVAFDGEEANGTLRECGLFLARPPGADGAGILLSYFTHPRIEKVEGMVLTRAIRVDLTPGPMAPGDGRPDRRGRWIELPDHWLTDLPVDTVDGVGDAYSAALAALGVPTLGSLADAEPAVLGQALPAMTAVEVHAKARLAIRSAGRVRLPAGMGDRTLRDVILAPAHELESEADASPETIQRLRERMFVLQVALSDRFLRQTTVRELGESSEV